MSRPIHRSLFFIPTLVAAGLCFVPLFNIIGYESGIALGIACGLVTVLSTGLAPKESGPPSNHFARLLLVHLLMVVGPGVLFCLNMLRVKSCDPWAGVGFWLVIIPGSICIAQAVAWIFRSALGHRHLGTALALGVVLAEALWFLWGLAHRPPITGHSWMIGYFAGSIYDEALSLPASLLWFRLENLLQVVVVVAAVDLFWHRPNRAPPVVWWSLVLGVLGSGWLVSTRKDHRIGMTHAYVQEKLGGRAETEHFVIYYSDGWNEDRVQALIEDHEFRYWELQRFFEVDPMAWRGRRIESYIYPDPGSQHRLMGSRRTFVARPWTHQMHLQWSNIGDTGLAHEMAHLFTAPFGHGPLQVATRGGIPADLGLIEGIALAADWPAKELPAHQATAAMFELGLAPRVKRLFSPTGFWTQPSRKAYTIMGSFVRWLVDTHGIDAFKTLYGKGNFDDAYNQPVEDLLAEWRAWLGTLPLSEHDLQQARHRYDKRSIFEKTCARTIAELDRKASGAAKSGKLDKARALREQILGYTPKSYHHRKELARVFQKMDQPDQALMVLDELLTRDLPAAKQAEVRELRGDLYTQQGQPDAAKTEYSSCLQLGLSDGERRRLTFKRDTMFSEDEALAEMAQRYLLDRGGTPQAIYLTSRWVAEDPGDPKPRYLLGFTLFHQKLYTDAIPWLVGPRGTIDEPAIDDQRRLLLARALVMTDTLDEAQAILQDLVDTTASHRVAGVAREWLDRIRWKR